MEEYDDEQDERITDLLRSQPEHALDLAKDLVARFPTTGRSWQRLAHAYDAKKMHADALLAIKKAIEIDREEPAYQFNISRLHMRVGAFCNAVETLSRCIDTSVRLQNDYYLEACYLYRAYCHLRIGHLADAEQDLERVTDDATVWMNGLIGKLEILEACRQHRRI